MNEAIDHLAKSITGRSSLHECSIEELQRLSDQYPFFGPLHFLLSQRLKKEDASAFDKQIQKTSLFFQNPLWLQYQVDSYVNEEEVAPPAEEPGVTREDQPTEETEKFTEEKAEEIVASPQPEELSAQPKEIITPAEPVVEEPKEMTGHDEIIHENHGEQPVTEMVQPEMNANTEVIEAPIEQNNTGEQISGHPSIVSETPESIHIADETEEEEPLPEEAGKSEPEIRLPQLKIEPVDASSSTLTFEPYHTVDYFASQGVSLNEEEKSKDKFGQQLKSFTEWLKTMKRLPESEVIVPPPVQQDPKVDRMAEHSVAAGDVVTETMAEVWEKQGNHAKAIETYHKLSLLNPGKSSYFAAKIEHLKHL